jgi:hypothetical protein
MYDIDRGGVWDRGNTDVKHYFVRVYLEHGPDYNRTFDGWEYLCDTQGGSGRSMRFATLERPPGDASGEVYTPFCMKCVDALEDAGIGHLVTDLEDHRDCADLLVPSPLNKHQIFCRSHWKSFTPKRTFVKTPTANVPPDTTAQATPQDHTSNPHQ